MSFLNASPIDKLFNLLSLSHFTEFYYHHDAVMTRDQRFVLNSHKPTAQSPKVHAFISQDKHLIHISFMVEKVSGLKFDDFCTNAINRQDNLWQDSCLECFIQLNNGYLEINAAPSGAYAIYQFDSYRYPTPPVQTHQANIIWQADDNDNVCVFERHFSLDLSVLADQLPQTTLINPCAVLNINGTLHYFSSHHDNEPDFHQSALWQTW